MAQKKPMKKARKTSSKPVSVRGGFAIPRSGIITSKDFARMAAKAAGSHVDPAAKVAATLLGTATGKFAAAAGGKTVEIVADAIARGRDKEAVAISDTTIQGSPNPNSTIGRKFRTSFEVGTPSTSTVRRLAKNNGTQKVMKYDTQVSAAFDSAERTSLTTRTGFNQKTVFWFDDKSYWTIGELGNMTNSNLYDRTVNSSQVAYWMTKYFGNRYTIMNKNKYLKQTVKVHFAKLVQPTFDPKAWLNDSFISGALPTTATTNDETIPYNLQLTPLTNVADKSQVGIDPKLGRLTKSSIFNQTFQIQKTFTRQIEPGETWEITYKHHTGPGLKLQDIIREVANANWDAGASAFYYPIFEIVGPVVECSESTNTNNTFIGTSSGSVQVEMQKFCEIVNAPADRDGLYETSDGYEKDNWAYRVFTDMSTTDNSSVISRRFNVDYADILPAGATAADDKFIIPVATETQTARGGKANIG